MLTCSPKTNHKTPSKRGRGVSHDDSSSKKSHLNSAPKMPSIIPRIGSFYVNQPTNNNWQPIEIGSGKPPKTQHRERDARFPNLDGAWNMEKQGRRMLFIYNSYERSN